MTSFANFCSVPYFMKMHHFHSVDIYIYIYIIERGVLVAINVQYLPKTKPGIQ